MLALRNDRHLASVLHTGGRTRDALGVAYPGETDARVRILEQWGIAARSPRHVPLATIDVPLPRRAQAALAWQVGPDLRGRLAAGMSPLADSRRGNATGPRERVRLGM